MYFMWNTHMEANRLGSSQQEKENWLFSFHVPYVYGTHCLLILFQCVISSFLLLFFFPGACVCVCVCVCVWCVCVCVCAQLCLCVQLCLTLCHPVNCSPPGSSVHGISQARILEWVAISSSRGSS